MTQFHFELNILHQNCNDSTWYTSTHFYSIKAVDTKSAFISAVSRATDISDMYHNGEIKSIVRM